MEKIVFVSKDKEFVAHPTSFQNVRSKSPQPESAMGGAEISERMVHSPVPLRHQYESPSEALKRRETRRNVVSSPLALVNISDDSEKLNEVAESSDYRESGLKKLKSGSFESIARWEKENEFLFAIIEDEADWLTRLFPDDPIEADRFFQTLEDGVLLCKLARMCQNYADEFAKSNNTRLNPFEIFIHPRKRCQGRLGNFMRRENVELFLKWCRHHKIHESLLFETNDVVEKTEQEGLRENAREIVLCLLEVARLGVKWGVEPPKLILLEREIEMEEQMDSSSLDGSISPMSVDSGVEDSFTYHHQDMSPVNSRKDRYASTHDDSKDLIDDHLDRIPHITSELKIVPIYDDGDVDDTEKENHSNNDNDNKSNSENKHNGYDEALPSRGSLSNEPSIDYTDSARNKRDNDSPEGNQKSSTSDYRSTRKTSESSRKTSLDAERMQRRRRKSSTNVKSELHQKVTKIIETYNIEKILRLKEGKYIILGKVMFVRLLNNHCIVRIGGGWDTLEHYLMTHAQFGKLATESFDTNETSERDSPAPSSTSTINRKPRRKLSNLLLKQKNTFLTKSTPNLLNLCDSPPNSGQTSPKTRSRSPSPNRVKDPYYKKELYRRRDDRKISQAILRVQADVERTGSIKKAASLDWTHLHSKEENLRNLKALTTIPKSKLRLIKKMADIVIDSNTNVETEQTDLPIITNDPPTPRTPHDENPLEKELDESATKTAVDNPIITTEEKIVNKNGEVDNIATSTKTVKKGQKTKTMVTKVTTKTSTLKNTVKTKDPVSSDSKVTTKKTLTKSSLASRPTATKSATPKTPVSKTVLKTTTVTSSVKSAGSVKPSVKSSTTTPKSNTKTAINKTSTKPASTTPKTTGKSISDASKTSVKPVSTSLRTSSATKKATDAKKLDEKPKLKTIGLKTTLSTSTSTPKTKKTPSASTTTTRPTTAGTRTTPKTATPTGRTVGSTPTSKTSTPKTTATKAVPKSAPAKTTSKTTSKITSKPSVGTTASKTTKPSVAASKTKPATTTTTKTGRPVSALKATGKTSPTKKITKSAKETKPEKDNQKIVEDTKNDNDNIIVVPTAGVVSVLTDVAPTDVVPTAAVVSVLTDVAPTDVVVPAEEKVEVTEVDVNVTIPTNDTEINTHGNVADGQLLTDSSVDNVASTDTSTSNIDNEKLVSFNDVVENDTQENQNTDAQEILIPGSSAVEDVAIDNEGTTPPQPQESLLEDFEPKDKQQNEILEPEIQENIVVHEESATVSTDFVGDTEETVKSTVEELTNAESKHDVSEETTVMSATDVSTITEPKTDEIQDFSAEATSTHVEELETSPNVAKKITFGEDVQKMSSADFDLYCVTPLAMEHLESDDDVNLSPKDSPKKSSLLSSLELHDSDEHKDISDESTPLSDVATCGTDRPGSQYLSPEESAEINPFDTEDEGGRLGRLGFADDTGLVINGSVQPVQHSESVTETDVEEKEQVASLGVDTARDEVDQKNQTAMDGNIEVAEQEPEEHHAAQESSNMEELTEPEELPNVAETFKADDSTNIDQPINIEESHSIEESTNLAESSNIAELKSVEDVENHQSIEDDVEELAVTEEEPVSNDASEYKISERPSEAWNENEVEAAEPEISSKQEEATDELATEKDSVETESENAEFFQKQPLPSEALHDFDYQFSQQDSVMACYGSESTVGEVRMSTHDFEMEAGSLVFSSSQSDIPEYGEPNEDHHEVFQSDENPSETHSSQTKVSSDNEVPVDDLDQDSAGNVPDCEDGSQLSVVETNAEENETEENGGNETASDDVIPKDDAVASDSFPSDANANVDNSGDENIDDSEDLPVEEDNVEQHASEEKVDNADEAKELANGDDIIDENQNEVHEEITDDIVNDNTKDVEVASETADDTKEFEVTSETTNVESEGPSDDAQVENLDGNTSIADLTVEETSASVVNKDGDFIASNIQTFQSTTVVTSHSNGTILMGEFQHEGEEYEDGESEASEEQDSPNHHVMLKQSSYTTTHTEQTVYVESTTEEIHSFGDDDAHMDQIDGGGNTFAGEAYALENKNDFDAQVSY